MQLLLSTCHRPTRFLAAVGAVSPVPDSDRTGDLRPCRRCQGDRRMDRLLPWAHRIYVCLVLQGRPAPQALGTRFGCAGRLAMATPGFLVASGPLEGSEGFRVRVADPVGDGVGAEIGGATQVLGPFEAEAVDDAERA